ncbi:hypothetical protein [Roseiconus lacunae]|uniref:hypothetical protein n=1 Tax=Roseiconus lacunae TaxID=2605694 RepID=UPI001E3FEA5B|nr:hypothetical protein [Roseiconus lacunae]MCD0462934.1 hypothetical protein [Roseiconus lacunae]
MRWLERYFLPLTVFTLLIVSVVAGVSMPSFYDWTGADQSRPAPVIPRIGMGLIGGTACFVLLLAWIPIEQRRRWSHFSGGQTSLRWLLVMTTLMAVACIPIPSLQFVFSYSVLAFAIVRTAYVAIKQRYLGCLLLAMAACIWGPFLWAFPDAQMLTLFAACPSLMELMCASALSGQHSDHIAFVGIYVTSAKLLFGTWLIQWGPRIGLVYCVVVLNISLAGSFVLHALMRM